MAKKPKGFEEFDALTRARTAPEKPSQAPAASGRRMETMTIERSPWRIVQAGSAWAVLNPQGGLVQDGLSQIQAINLSSQLWEKQLADEDAQRGVKTIRQMRVEPNDD